MDDSRFLDRNVLVMGLGRFGGGIGVARWMCAQGARVTVTDLADEAALAESVAQLDDCKITFRLGGHDDNDLESTDLAVVSPAVDRRRSPFFAEVLRRRIAWTTEINLFLARCRGQVVGVTGTAGKSTTCALLDETLAESDDDNQVECILQRKLVKGIAKKFMTVYERTNGEHGYVSIQGDPINEEDPQVIIDEGRKNRAMSPNIMI
ncbi:MAG: hypothetical protein GY778_21515, partial [bacterium]|nr:hypothetical protein [bacterium]